MADAVTFVAGGSGGLGAAICAALAAKGRRVFFTYRTNREAADALADTLAGEGGDVSCGQVDLQSLPDVEHALNQAREMGSIEAVVYAAGPSIPQQWFSRVSPDDWRRNVAGEIEGFFNLAYAALPRLREHPASSLVATTSFATRRVVPGDVLSAVPKAAIDMLIRQIAREEGRYGIRANCVSPGIIDAGLGLKAQQDHYTPEIWARQRKAVPLGNFGSAEAIAAAVLFLLSDAAAYVTGQTITVDGGMSV